MRRIMTKTHQTGRPVGIPDPDTLATYYVALLTAVADDASDANDSDGSLENEQMAHIDYLFSLQRAGKVPLFGPFLDERMTRGLVLFKVDSADEARALMDEDPHVRGGHLSFEIRPWMTQKGVLP